MGTLNEILSLMYKMDNGYSKAVNLNEGSLAHTLIVEGTREKQARQRSRDMIRQVFSDEQLTDEQVEEKLNKFENDFYHDPKMRSSAVMRLEPLFCRLAFWYGYGESNVPYNVISNLKNMLKFLYRNQNQINLVNLIPNETLYTLKYDELSYMVEELMEEYPEDESDEENQNETNQKYQIVGPLDFEEANEIGKKSSTPGGELCYTKYGGTWNRYTSNGRNKVYAALADGWDNTTLYPAVHDKNFVSPYDPTQTPTDESPYDKYGLSMIFLFISPRGELVTCNTRWNHKASYPSRIGTDNALNINQVSDIVGIDLKNTICKNNENQFYERLQEAIDLLKNGDASGFDNIDPLTPGNQRCQAISICDKWNVLDNGRIKYKEWFDRLIEGNVVEYEGKYNILNEFGDFIFDVPFFKWFDYICYLTYFDVYNIQNNQGKTNFFKNGKERGFVSNIWFDNASFIDSKYYPYSVRCGNKYNLLTLDFKLVNDAPLEEWWDNLTLLYINDDDDGFLILKDHKYNILYKEEMFDRWFDLIENRYYVNYYRAVLNGEYFNIYPIEKKIVSVDYKDFFDDVQQSDIPDLYIVFVKDKKNFMDEDGNLLSSIWFDEVVYKKMTWGLNIYAVLFREDKKSFVNFIKTVDRTYLWKRPVDEWFDKASKLRNFIFVKKDGKKNLLDFNGNLVFDVWMDEINEINSQALNVRVQFGGKNRINVFDMETNKLVWDKPVDEWFEACGGPMYNTCVFECGECWFLNKGDKQFTVIKDNKILGKIDVQR